MRFVLVFIFGLFAFMMFSFAVMAYVMLEFSRIGVPADIAIWLQWVQLGVTGLLAVLGLVFFWLCVASLVAIRRRSQVRSELLQNGIDTQGVITFIDRNWGFRVNGAPIYSIVEYRFADSFGKEYVERKPDVSAEEAIRRGWQVSSAITVRYLPSDPTKSGIVMSGEGAS